MSALELVQVFSSSKCLICGQGPEDFDIGRFYELREFSVHYLCILTGFNLPQNGTSNEGLLGFLLSDIVRAFRMYCVRMCLVCKKSGASLQCTSCRRTYHLPCALNNGMVVQMLEHYPFYCKQCSQDFVLSKKVPRKSDCPICLSSIINGERIYSPICCKTLEWMHINCLQKYALTSGYKMKCPLCSNRKKFRLSVKRSGVYIPNEDATWLWEEANFQSRFTLRCSAHVCMLMDDFMRGTLVNCAVCSDSMGHYSCTFAGIFVCATCTPLLWPQDSSQLLKTKRRRLSVVNNKILFLLVTNQTMNSNFPWLLSLIISLVDEEQSEKMVMDLAGVIGREFVSSETKRRENYFKSQEVTLELNLHPADEDLQEIEIQSLREQPNQDLQQAQQNSDAKKKMNGESSEIGNAAADGKPVRKSLGIADLILAKIREAKAGSGKSNVKRLRLAKK